MNKKRAKKKKKRNDKNLIDKTKKEKQYRKEKKTREYKLQYTPFMFVFSAAYPRPSFEHKHT